MLLKDFFVNDYIFAFQLQRDFVTVNSEIISIEEIIYVIWLSKNINENKYISKGICLLPLLKVRVLSKLPHL